MVEKIMEGETSNLEITYTFNNNTVAESVTALINKTSQQAASRLAKILTSWLLFFIGMSAIYLVKVNDFYSDNNMARTAILVLAICVPLNLYINFELLNRYRKKIILDSQKILPGEVKLILSNESINWSSEGIQADIAWSKVTSVYITPQAIVVNCPVVVILIPLQGYGAIESETKGKLITFMSHHVDMGK